MVIHHLLSGMILQVAIDETNQPSRLLRGLSKAQLEPWQNKGQVDDQWKTCDVHWCSNILKEFPIYIQICSNIFQHVP